MGMVISQDKDPYESNQDDSISISAKGFDRW